MGIRRLEKNTAIRLDGRECKILSILEDGTYKLEDIRGRILHLQPLDLTRKLRTRELTIVAQGALPRQRTPGVLPSKELAIIRDRLQYVRAVDGLPHTLPLIDAATGATWAQLKRPAKKPSASTVRRWKIRYQASGRDPRALLDNHRAKGNRVPRFPSDVIEICLGAIARRYLTRERGTVDAISMLRFLWARMSLLPTDRRMGFSTRLLENLTIMAVQNFLALCKELSPSSMYSAIYTRDTASTSPRKQSL